MRAHFWRVPIRFVFRFPDSLWPVASGTIAGTAADASGAVIPDADITLENTASGDKRVTVSNGSGFFNFAAVPPANYKVTIKANGFGTWVGTDIILHLGESMCCRILP